MIPEECLEWWRTQGWVTLGWKGAREEADSDVIEAKIKMMVKNHKRRTMPMESQEEGTNSQGDVSQEFGSRKWHLLPH